MLLKEEKIRLQNVIYSSYVLLMLMSLGLIWMLSGFEAFLKNSAIGLPVVFFILWAKNRKLFNFVVGTIGFIVLLAWFYDVVGVKGVAIYAVLNIAVFSLTLLAVWFRRRAIEKDNKSIKHLLQK